MNLLHNTAKGRLSRFQNFVIVALLLPGFLFGPATIGRAKDPEGDKTPKVKKTKKDGKPAKKKFVTKRVIVKPLSEPKPLRGCGAYFWPVKFELESETTKGGWIVQEIELVEKIYDCDGMEIDELSLTFWEVWPVDGQGNKKTPSNREPRLDPTTPRDEYTEYDDTYSHGAYSRRSMRGRGGFSSGLQLPPSGAARGTITIKGWVKFYEGVTLAKSFKKGNRKTLAGPHLKSSKKRPSFWSRDGASEHHLTWKWDCCGTSGTGTHEPPVTVPVFVDPPKTSGGTSVGEGGKATDKTGTTPKESKSSPKGKNKKPEEDKTEEKSKTTKDESSNRSADMGVDVFSGSSTALAEAVLPEGTPVVTAPVVPGSTLKFNEPGTVFLASATATAGVEDEPTDAASREVVPVRVKRGDVISSDRLVAVLLDTGMGIIVSRVREPSRITVHTGRDVIVDEPSEEPRSEPTETPGDKREPQVSLNNGSFVASILTDKPYTKSAVGTSDWSKPSAKSHVEILVDGKKQGEVATFSGVDPKLLNDKPLRFWTLNERGQFLREGTFDGKTVDVSLKVRFDKPVYRIGDEGVLVIWNQETFVAAQQANRIGGSTKASDWILTIDTSESLAGIPKTTAFETHRLPFTVVTKGQLRATVRAKLQRRPAELSAR